MANKFNYRSGPRMLRPAPIGSGVQCEIGDMMKFSSGKITRVTATTDNLSFAGVAAQRHSSTDGSGTVNIYVPNPQTIFEYDLDASTAMTIGDDLQINARQTLKKSATDPVATAVESKLAATTVLVAFRLTQHTNSWAMLGDAS